MGSECVEPIYSDDYSCYEGAVSNNGLVIFKYKLDEENKFSFGLAIYDSKNNSIRNINIEKEWYGYEIIKWIDSKRILFRDEEENKEWILNIENMTFLKSGL